MERKTPTTDPLLASPPWQKIPFFKGIPMPLLQNLLEGAFVTRVKSREIVLEQDQQADSFVFVLEGLFRLYRTNSKNQRVIMDFVGPGGMVGGLLMAHPQITYPVTCQAVGIGEILRIPKATYLKHWLQDPEIISRTQNANIERMQALHSTRELQKYPLEEKIVQFLLRMSASLDAEITVRISKTDLADAIGACAESVIRVFSAWEKKGWIRLNKDGFDVIDKCHLISREVS